MMTTQLFGPDGVPRCAWCSGSSEMMEYHDAEWGYPVAGDRHLFEKLCLEGFQSGLSWRTILAKRENFRSAFREFDFDHLVQFTERDAERLLQDAGIVRHRGKIEAVINNARRAQELVRKEASLAAYFWRFEPASGSLPEPQSVSVSPESTALSKALRAAGWKFVGPTTVYAFMQAVGLVNDHVVGCAHRDKVERVRAAFKRPTGVVTRGDELHG